VAICLPQDLWASPTGEIHLSPSEVGASIDLLLSLKTIDEVLDFIERRVQVLYAGSLAESLAQKKIQDDLANMLLMSTAANNFAKVRELLRMWVGLNHPEVTESTFQEKLTQVNERLYSKAAKLVKDNAGLIIDLAVFVMGERDAGLLRFRCEPAFSGRSRRPDNLRSLRRRNCGHHPGANRVRGKQAAV
jgi:hypothetical protein